MKLQELLNKYKDKVHNWVYDDILHFEETNEIIYIYYQEDWKRISINDSLSDLLFSTPFLSLLEWREYEWDCYDKYTKYQSKACYQETDYCYENYHKINLVLLNTDAERIEYIEAFTL